MHTVQEAVTWFLFLYSSHCSCSCSLLKIQTNLWVLEERRALYVGDSDIFYLLLLSFCPLSPSLSLFPRGYCVRSPWYCIPPSIFALLLCFLSSFLYVGSSALIHEHMGRRGKNWHTRENKEKHVARVSMLMNISFLFFVSEAIMYLTPLSTYEPHWLRSREITGEWSSAQWTPVGKPWDAVLAQGPFHSLLGCKKSSLVKCGCNSMHILLAWFQTCESPATFKFLLSDSKVLCCSSIESMAVSPVGETTESVSAFIGGTHLGTVICVRARHSYQGFCKSTDWNNSY